VRWLRPGGSILDFGSGPCDKTAVLAALGYRCFACDDLKDDWHLLGENRERIQSFARNARVEFIMTESLDRLPFNTHEFDMLMMHHVLEHLHDSPRDLVSKLLNFVKPEGLLYVTVPNAVNLHKRLRVVFGKTNLPPFECYYWYPGRWRGHVREYDRSDLVRFCEFLGLEILQLRGVHHALHAIPHHLKLPWVFATALVQGGRDTWSLVARKPPDWRPLSLSADEMKGLMERYTTYRYEGVALPGEQRSTDDCLVSMGEANTAQYRSRIALAFRSKERHSRVSPRLRFAVRALASVGG